MEDAEKYFLQPGFIFVSEQPYLIHTVLGSCVSICIWDPAHKFGGMNHYIYSHAAGKPGNARYGNVSIPHLLNLMDDFGAKRSELNAHIVGGADNPNIDSKVGRDNVAIAEELMAKHRIKVVSIDTGGILGRKVVFDNITGEIFVYKVQNIRKEDWFVHHE